MKGSLCSKVTGTSLTASNRLIGRILTTINRLKGTILTIPNRQVVISVQQCNTYTRKKIMSYAKVMEGDVE